MPLTHSPHGVSSFGIPIFGGTHFVPVPRLDGRVFFVDGTNGNDANSGENMENAYVTIEQAVSNAVSGRSDTIIVSVGSYDENLVINKDDISLIASNPVPWARPDIAPTTGIALLANEAQGFYCSGMTFISADDVAVHQRGNGFAYDWCQFLALTDGLLLEPINTDPDDTWGASQGWVYNSTFWECANGVRFKNPGPSGGFGGIGPTDVALLNNVFKVITNQYIIDEDTGGSNDNCFFDCIVNGNHFLDRNKAVGITLTNGGNNRGLITGNYFSDDAGLDNTKIALATAIVFAGNYDAVGVVNGSGF